jgi:hypothetical protein
LNVRKIWVTLSSRRKKRGEGSCTEKYVLELSLP